MSQHRQLRAGPLSMIFDRERAFLRHLRLGNVEVVRGVFAAVRDQDWNTVPFSVSDFELDQNDDSFLLKFLARCDDAEVKFDWSGTVSGSAEGIVRFRFAGQARSRFRKNRIGLCVLHPIHECAGRACEVEHTDGSVAVSAFPRHIAPQQPFWDLRAITHEVQSGLRARVRVEGEVFEMEDQRNWTDASFKTYSTPLELPFPVEMAAGSRVNHEVKIELQYEPAATVSRGDAAVSETIPRVAVDFENGRCPADIGLGMATCDSLLSEAGPQRLSQLKPSHLRVDLQLGREDWLARAQTALGLCERIDCAIEVALFAVSTADAAWQQALSLFQEQPVNVARWLVFHPHAKATPEILAKTAHESLSEWDDSVPIVVGTDAYFAELNRNRPPVFSNSQICYSINPQVHAFDNLSLSETLEAHRATVDSAWDLFSCPIVVSPVTLRPRFNPNATSADPEAAESVPETDQRQATGFAAAWTVGALSQLVTHPNVASVTFYETHGPRGVMDENGNAYPSASVLEAVNSCRQVCEAAVSHPLEVAAVGLIRPDGGRAVVIGNLSQQRRRIVVGAAETMAEIAHDIEAESVRIVKWEAGS